MKRQENTRPLTEEESKCLAYKKWSERTPAEKQLIKNMEHGREKYTWFANRMIDNPDKIERLSKPFIIEKLQGTYVKPKED